MLSLFRRLAKSWIATALFAVLIASFALWGIGSDMVRSLFQGDDALARVGGEPIPLEEAQAATRREMRRIAAQLGPRFQDDPAVRRAIATQALEQLIAQRSLLAEARRLGIVVPESAVRDAVFAMPGLQGSDGRFSRAILEAALRQYDLTEAQFITLVRADIARQQLLGGVRSGGIGPDALTHPLLAWARERRSADVVELALLDAPEPPPPDEAALRRFHENNPERFSAPEYRQAVVAALTPDSVAAEVQVPDADIAAAYERRRGEFESGERRQIDQALVDSEEKARAIAAAWRGGADFAAIERQAAEAGGTALHLGALDRDGLPVPALADAAFAAPEGGVTDPVQSPFGWHVLRVAKIEPPASRPLEAVRDEIRRDLQAERAIDLSYRRANEIEDALAGGATLEEVARRFGLATATVTTDATGRDAAGAAVTLPVPQPQREATLRAIFAAGQGAAPQFTETPDGFVGVEVRQVTPAALRPFAEIEDQVRRAWLADARRRSQEERAAALLGAVRGGRPLPEAAREAGLRADRLGPFGRQPDPQAPASQPQPPPELLAPLFEAKVGDPTMVETRAGFAVAQLATIERFDPASDPLALGRLRGEVEQAMADDLETQYAAALRRRAEVRVNQRLLDSLAGPAN
ncbi:SurA N-terminal domain-containing protein [Roseomonas sp. NAR14]|uniref:Parvulin-like PPIase n=1 Tax=Roseomonas acroporae TaxID=2937791 RepID=A0A9X2BW68_9PROT|nr:peptidylprolyl isomerase [Roseomonas acroporae]MCK8783540.1 SurA N-terminal domain-containing protein [Roseomonas acroporae]